MVVEAIPVSYSDGMPAALLLSSALKFGWHAVSANKGPVVHHRDALLRLADRARPPLRYLHESAVMDGVPIFNMAAAGLPLAKLTRLRGCLNSTTTVVLSAMEGVPQCREDREGSIGCLGGSADAGGGVRRKPAPALV